ncbi:hypothetical protein HDU67_002536 [Dinochytrium kinnereticum]|nr:hypothetical protein HDU67_002536 [Dinochytrium kinnereticum]
MQAISLPSDFDHPLAAAISEISLKQEDADSSRPAVGLARTDVANVHLATTPRVPSSDDSRLRPGRDLFSDEPHLEPFRAIAPVSVAPGSLIISKKTSGSTMAAIEREGADNTAIHPRKDFRRTTGDSNLEDTSEYLGSGQRLRLNDVEEHRIKPKSSFRKSLVKMLDSFHVTGSSSDSSAPLASGTTSVGVERAKSLKEVSGNRKRPMAERALTLIRAKSPPLQEKPSHQPSSSISQDTNGLIDPLTSAPSKFTGTAQQVSPPRSDPPYSRPVHTRTLSQPGTHSKHFKSLSAPIGRSHDTHHFDSEKASAGGGVSASHSLVLINGYDKDDEDDFEKICAVFVARFDTLRGNMIEYQHPLAADLSGVEYQSLPSGSHAVISDVIYFRKGSHYGICAFQRHVLTARDAEMQKERGARVRSVGILSSSFSGLHRHLPFLRSMANAFSVNLGEHEDLRTYYEARSLEVFPRVGLIESVGLPDLQALLHKRVLFYGIPPVENLCYNIFCMNLLGAHTLPLFPVHLRSQFFINVADIIELEHLKSFLACTTESIFGSKQQLWDLYVHHQDTSAQLIFSTSHIKSETTGEQTAPIKHSVNEVDVKRFAELSRFLENSSPIAGAGGVAVIKEEGSAVNPIVEMGENIESADRLANRKLNRGDVSVGDSFDSVSKEMKKAFTLVQYFSDLNTKLFTTLYDISRSEDPVLRPCRLKNLLGLHPQSDSAFIRDLVRLYDIPVELDLRGKRWSAIGWRGGRINCDCCTQAGKK